MHTEHSAIIDVKWAKEFANEWVAAWNAGDLERILAHYADDFEMTSPLIVERMGVASGKLKGKDAIRPYWAKGISAQPPLNFKLLDVFVGVKSVAMHYHSISRSRFVVERVEFNAQRQAIRAEALYRSE